VGTERTAEPADILAQILENNAVAITVVDDEGRLTLFNRAAEQLVGYAREEVLGRPVAMFYEKKEEVERIWAKVQREGKAEDEEVTLVDKQGRRRDVSIVVTALHDEAGRNVGTLGISVDISHRARLEREVREAVRRAEFYNDLLCHDVRNYDQTILGYLDLLVRGKIGPLSEQQRRVLQICRRQAQRMREFIDRMTTLVRLERGRSSELRPLALKPVVERVASEVREVYADREAVVEVRVPEACHVLAGPLLDELLFNLVSNGLVHNLAPGPRVWVAAEPGDLDGEPSWRVRVEDNGPGIGDARKPELFERFTRRAAHGTGIGLSLVKALCEGYGGKVWVEDRVPGLPEQGSRFVAELRASQP
jgi:PAS domain S-box-containing protein